MSVIKYIDLFNGLGAFHQAFNQNSNDKIKYECVFACDINSQVRDIYEENYGLKPKGDINEINIEKDIPDFDILCAGFPCQPFSISGKKEGFDNPTQGNLFFKILEILDKKTPNLFILENVKNLETINNGETFQRIKTELEKRKYFINYKVLNAKDFGSPQSRQRIYIIGSKIKPYIFQNPLYINKNVAQIIDFNNKDYLNLTEKYDLVKNPNENSHLLYRLINKKTKKGGRQGERVYSINHSGPTICAQSGGIGSSTGLYEIEEGKIRGLSIQECLKMFGFPANFKYDTLKDDKLIKKRMLYFLGNSIVVDVLKYIIQPLYSIYFQEKT